MKTPLAPLKPSDFRSHLSDRLAFWIATFFGSGLSPVAPGTAGSLAALPLVAVVSTWTLIAQISVWAGVTALGTWAAARVCERTKTADHGSIVIDEVVGLGISVLFCSFSVFQFALAFALFRFFDITKIPPVRQLDQWSKKKAFASGPLWAGFGIMADDIVAGLQALMTYWTLQQLGWIPL